MTMFFVGAFLGCAISLLASYIFHGNPMRRIGRAMRRAYARK